MKYILIIIVLLGGIYMMGAGQAEEQFYNVLMHKNNEQRTGFYDTSGVPVLHGIKWKFAYNGIANIDCIYNNNILISGSNLISYTLNLLKGEKVAWEMNNYSPVGIYRDVILGIQRLYDQTKPLIVGFDRANNKRIWENNEIQSIINFMLNNDKLYVVSRFEGGEDSPVYMLYVVNPMTGETLETIDPGTDIDGIAFWKDTMVYTANEGVYAIDFAKKSSKREPMRLFTRSDETILKKIQTEAEKNMIGTIPVINNEHVYFGDYVGNLYALNLKTKKIRWQLKLTNSFYSNNSPSVYDGILYFENDKTIYYVNEATGKIIYSKNYDTGINPDIAVTRGETYFTTSNGYLYALDNKTGKELWNIQLAKQSRVGPIVSQGVLYVSAYDKFDEKGYIFAVH